MKIISKIIITTLLIITEIIQTSDSSINQKKSIIARLCSICSSSSDIINPTSSDIPQQDETDVLHEMVEMPVIMQLYSIAHVTQIEETNKQLINENEKNKKTLKAYINTIGDYANTINLQDALIVQQSNEIVMLKIEQKNNQKVKNGKKTEKIQAPSRHNKHYVSSDDEWSD